MYKRQVYGGVDFLRAVNLGHETHIGKRCAVIGGGNVAMDVCRSAVRLGADETYVLYRRSEAELPADPEEVKEAMEEGVQFRFLTAPVEILGENGKVTGCLLYTSSSVSVSGPRSSRASGRA